jgi:hypothetical protein
MKEFYTDKGVRVVINPAPTRMAKQLKQVILKQLRKHDIEIGDSKSISDMLNYFRKNSSQFINLLKNVWIDLETDDDFERIVSACVEKCTFDGIGITDDLFDNKEEAKEYYMQIRYDCVIETLKPFFKRTLGELSVPLNTKDDSQE